jgi:hypothetical protein
MTDFCFQGAGRGGGRNGCTLRLLAEIGNIIATRCVIANPHKQQIPPLRCAPAGMTYYVNHFRPATRVSGVRRRLR